MLWRLQLAKEKAFKKLIVNVDIIFVVGLLKGDIRCNARHSSIIQKCKGILHLTEWEVRINHCFREANQVDDVLANIGVDLNNDFIYFNEPPREALNLLYVGQRGVVVDQ